MAFCCHASAPAQAVPASTATTVNSSLNPSNPGDTVLFDARVTGGGGAPTGSVTFKDGSTTIGSGTLNTVGATSAPAAGGYHSCALTAAGGVKCWGYNGYGQLGDNSTTTRTAPVDVSGLTSGVTAIASGTYSTCALTTAGGVKCWGRNFYGELGNNNTGNNSSIPVDVSGLTSGVIAIAVGELHACALTAAGGIKCWGYGGDGQLGNGSYGNRATPIDVTGLSSGISAIATGTHHTCAIAAPAGLVKCWGNNEFGQLGDGTATFREGVVDSTLTGATAIALGEFHSCAINANGGAMCWGRNQVGQLGDGTFDDRISILAVSSLGSGVAAITSGPYHSCALNVNGVALCWGQGIYGKLGDNNAQNNSAVPVTAVGVTGSAISGGIHHTCAVAVDGSVRCWGDNENGQIGIGTITTLQITSVQVNGFGAGTAQNTSRTSFSTSSLTSGDHTITAVYGADAGHAASTSANLIQAVSRTATTTSLGSSVNPSTSGQSVTFTATVNNAAASGTVTFKIDGVSQDPLATVASGVATLTTSALGGGDHAIIAIYNGDSSYFGSTSSTLTQTVTGKASTTTTLGADINPSVPGESVTFTATVSSTGGTPTGTITFKDRATTLGPGTLSGGSAALSTSALSAGSHTITAVYNGDDNFATSESSGLTQTVAKLATTTALSASPNPSGSGQSVTFTATVSSSSGTPAGTVTFKEGATTLGTGTLSSSVATFTTSSLAVGAHTITAVYSGNGTYATSTSSGVTQNVIFGTTTKLATSPKSSKSGQSVKMIAGVTAVKPPKGIKLPKAKPMGSVTYKKGVDTLATAPLLNGKATGSTSVLTAGINTLTAAYGGDMNYGPSTGTVNHTVKAPAMAVAKLADGHLVATWETAAKNGADSAIHARRYTADGAAVGNDFRVAAASSRQAVSEPSVAGLQNGTFVVVWTADGRDGSGLGLYGQLYSAAAIKVGAEIRVNASTHNDQSQSATAALDDGGFAVVWTSKQQAKSGSTIYGQRYGAEGRVAGGEFVVAVDLADQTQPSLTGLGGGGFVVAWSSATEQSDIVGQRYTAAGLKAGAAFSVNQAQEADQTDPSVAALDDGGFVVSWTAAGREGAAISLAAQRFNAAGAAVGRAFTANTSVDKHHWDPTVVPFADGGFLAVWNTQDKKGSTVGARVQAFDANGKRVGTESVVKTPAANVISQPRAVTSSHGNFVVLWTAGNAKDSLRSVQKQRFKNFSAQTD
jgi:alpha-tubulin suppressor-like RCC1 family protein